MKHKVDVHWQRVGEFSHEGFERRHDIAFQPQVGLPAGGAGNDFGADPEQMLAAAMSSCHMQTFLALAAKKRLTVESYHDEAEAVLAQREDGRFFIATLILRPRVQFSGEKIPDDASVEAMHIKAHEHCFVANSVLSEVIIEPEFPSV
ncbi:MAG: osmotically inducible protein OsmC [Oceanospirillaceae bacterium]|jgi:organic hydroperoxide reductase OsmC/OhrA|uniref:OsmC family protein n=1 Tax=Thalassolituus sp. UBA3500 TaxID=1947664 RepID=UPI000C10EF58|nr:OsmC family protein [Thalassolituus sp. UBA3500]MAE35997.1 osmotically inducible protein OsmC [Oceanospirillaceae bacterium]MBN57987.1 osmotically inducible protein OsmC [Oceanospirillaceae bacterium]|tara:strand:- start:80 stop:523 length:444 start_codon:yes stop_codon:yes gene_type:complete